MKLELEFQGSVISEVKIIGSDLEILFSHVVIITDSPQDSKPKTSKLSASIKIEKFKSKKLPKSGVVSDGELYGIPNKALNGRLPIDFHYQRDCELEITLEHIDFVISGKAFHLSVEMSKLPDEYRH